MTKPKRLLTALFLLTLTIGSACTGETVRISPTPTVAASTAAPTTAAPTRTATAAPTTAAPTPTRSAAPTTSPGSSPNAACQPITGGSPLSAPAVTQLRASHQPGYDRVVFEFSGQTVPAYEIKVAQTFVAPSGQAVRVDGNAFISVRFTAQAHTDAGQRSYPQPDPFRPGLPVVREVKLVEDFEAVVVFGVGLERLVCPTVLTLLGPARVVLDFPTPP